MSKSSPHPSYLVALDVGTSKVSVVIGEPTPDGRIQVVGHGQKPSRGLKRGVVSNIEATVEAVHRAVEAAEHMASCRLRSAQVGITGSHLKGMNTAAVTPVRGEVTGRDMQQVLDNASAVVLAGDQQLISVVPQEYVLDTQDGITDPIGMVGGRLEVRAHIISGNISSMQNLERCIQRCNLEVERFVTNHVAAGDAVLTPDEKELGVCVVDMGGGTCDLAVYRQGALRYTAVIPVAGDQVTSDIAMAFRTPLQHAEDIKLKFGCCLPELLGEEDQDIETPAVGESPSRRLSRRDLTEIIRPRYAELFRFIHRELLRTDYADQLAGGVVLTGGAALIPGAQELAEETLQMPVRIGYPQGIDGSEDVTRNPAAAVAVGLLMSARRNPGSTTAGGGGEDIFSRLKRWWAGNL